MRFIHSYWTNPRPVDYDFSTDLWYAAVSISYVHQQGHTIALHTDSRGYEIFSILPYDEIIISLDDIKYDHHIWSASKFVSMNIEPCGTIHIDYDFFPKDISMFESHWDPKEDMLCQHIIPDNTDYQFVSRYIKKACPKLILPEGVHHEFGEHILHLGAWAINNIQLKEKIMNAYDQYATDLTNQFPKYLWNANESFVANLSLEEKLVGELSYPYNVYCLVDVYNPDGYLNLQGENSVCEHFAGSEKKYRLNYVKSQLEVLDKRLYDILKERL